MKGYLYILSNPLMPSIIKIGFTSRSPEERKRELSKPSGIPVDFVIEYEIFSYNIKLLERRVHEDFKHLRVNGKKEFFQIDLKSAISKIRERNEEINYEITAKVMGVNETFDKYEAIEILNKLKLTYKDKIRSEIKSVRIYQTALRCYVEVTEEDELSISADSGLSEEEMEFYKIPMVNQTIRRTDLLFVVTSPDDPKKNDVPIFNPKNPVSMNARIFVEEFDEMSIAICADIFK